MHILSHLSERGSNFNAPKNDNFNLNISIGIISWPIVLSCISEPSIVPSAILSHDVHVTSILFPHHVKFDGHTDNTFHHVTAASFQAQPFVATFKSSEVHAASTLQPM